MSWEMFISINPVISIEGRKEIVNSLTRSTYFIYLLHKLFFANWQQGIFLIYMHQASIYQNLSYTSCRALVGERHVSGQPDPLQTMIKHLKSWSTYTEPIS